MENKCVGSIVYMDLTQLPWIWQIIIIVLTLFVTIILGFKARRFVFKGDKIRIGIGGEIQNKKNCGRCYMLLRQQMMKTERDIRSLQSSRLDRQMNFFDQKFLELQTKLLDIYMDKLSSDVDKDEATEENKQSILFDGMLATALHRAKKEIRRALKENGYTDKNPTEFTAYVKDEAGTVLRIITNHFRNLYPNEKMHVNRKNVLDLFSNELQTIEGILFDCFNSAKEINQNNMKEIEQLDDECDEKCARIIGIPLKELKGHTA